MTVSRAAVVLLIAQAIAGCSSTRAPATPTPAATPSVPPTPATVASIEPTVGSTGGATQLRITGTGLGASVTIGGAAVTGRIDSRAPGTLLAFNTPPHAAGTVDMVVSGANGQAVTVPNAFTYASPETFNFNGNWSGFGGNGQDNLIRFTIENNLLLRLSCDSLTADPDTIITFPVPRPVTSSQLSVDEDSIHFTARIVSPATATGIIRVGQCASDAWYAVKS